MLPEEIIIVEHQTHQNYDIQSESSDIASKQVMTVNQSKVELVRFADEVGEVARGRYERRIRVWQEVIKAEYG